MQLVDILINAPKAADVTGNHDPGQHDVWLRSISDCNTDTRKQFLKLYWDLGNSNILVQYACQHISTGTGRQRCCRSPFLLVFPCRFFVDLDLSRGAPSHISNCHNTSPRSWRRPSANEAFHLSDTLLGNQSRNMSH